jgi:hypothetical protein
MAESSTVVTQVGFFSKLMESIKGVVVGFAMFLLAFPLVFFNECNSVNTAQMLASGRGQVVSVGSDRVEPANEGALVHFSGEATTPDTVADHVFGVSVPAIRLRRSVEMFQWEETKRTEERQKLGGGTERVDTYSYDTRWSADLVDSSMPYESESWQAANVSVGAFALSPDLVGQLDRWEALTMDDARVAALPESMRGRVIASGGKLFFGADPAAPRVGDLRVAFEVVQPSTASVVAQQRGGGVQAWADPEGRGDIAMVEFGTRTADEMFEAAEAANRLFTWILRGVSFLMMWIGLSLVFRPFAVLAGVVPFFGNMVSAFTGLIAGLLAAAIWTVTVGVAWLAVRPLLAIVLLSVSAVAFVGFIAAAIALFKATRRPAAA